MLMEIGDYSGGSLIVCEGDAALKESADFKEAIEGKNAQLEVKNRLWRTGSLNLHYPRNEINCPQSCLPTGTILVTAR